MEIENQLEVQMTNYLSSRVARRLNRSERKPIKEPEPATQSPNSNASRYGVCMYPLKHPLLHSLVANPE